MQAARRSRLRRLCSGERESDQCFVACVCWHPLSRPPQFENSPTSGCCCCRGSLTAGQRRIAYDSLGMYQSLHQAALDPLSPEAWSQTMQHSRTVSAILAADGVRWAGGGRGRVGGAAGGLPPLAVLCMQQTPANPDSLRGYLHS